MFCYEELPVTDLKPVKTVTYCKRVFTKVDPVYATKVTADGKSKVTAIFDGKYTRFFATKGDYISAVPGDYTEHYNGIFYNGNTGFEFSEDADGVITSAKTPEFEKRKAFPINIYESSTGNVFMFEEKDNHIVIRRRGEGLAVAAIDLMCANDRELVVEDGKLVDSENGKKYVLFDGEFHTDNLDPEMMYSLGKYGVKNGGYDTVPFIYDKVTTGDGSVFRAEKDGRVYYFAADGTQFGNENGYTAGADVYDGLAWVFDGGDGRVLKFS